jgi:hypothetical protein
MTMPKRTLGVFIEDDAEDSYDKDLTDMCVLPQHIN